MTRLQLGVLLASFLAFSLVSPVRSDPSGRGAGGVTISEAGTDDNGQTLFNITADSADISEVLKAVFGKTQAQYGIGQDVTGTVDLRLERASADQILKRVAALASPPLQVTRDAQGYHVQRDPKAVDATRTTAIRGPNSLPVIPVSPFGGGGTLQQGLPDDRFVTLDVPESRPVPLSEVIAQISAQTRVPIVLDRRFPRNVVFYGHITHTPLPLALQTVANTAGLKVVVSNSQAYVVPGDQYTLFLSRVANPGAYGNVMGQSPQVQCPHCGRPVVSTWPYCPWCGQALGTGSGVRGGRGGGARPGR